MKRKIAVIICLLIFVALTCCSCSQIASFWNSTNDDKTTVHINIDDLDSNTVASVVANNCMGSCVRIVTTFSNGSEVAGSGFFITTDGYVVTNRHVVVDSIYPILEIKVIFEDNSYYTADRKIYSTDQYLDLAILKVNNAGDTQFEPLELDQTTSLYYGQQAYTIGNPLNVGIAIYSEMIAKPSIQPEEVSPRKAILLDGNINHGNSGGALINENSKVIGIVYGRAEKDGDGDGVNDAVGMGLAIPTKDLISYINGSTYKNYIHYVEYIPTTEET